MQFLLRLLESLAHSFNFPLLLLEHAPLLLKLSSLPNHRITVARRFEVASQMSVHPSLARHGKVSDPFQGLGDIRFDPFGVSPFPSSASLLLDSTGVIRVLEGKKTNRRLVITKNCYPRYPRIPRSQRGHLAKKAERIREQSPEMEVEW